MQQAWFREEQLPKSDVIPSYGLLVISRFINSNRRFGELACQIQSGVVSSSLRQTKRPTKVRFITLGRALGGIPTWKPFLNRNGFN